MAAALNAHAEISNAPAEARAADDYALPWRLLRLLNLFRMVVGGLVARHNPDFFAALALGIVSGAIAAVVIGGLLLAARAWWAIAFDATAVAASGASVSAYRFMLHGIVALAVILCVKLSGIVLTTGLMVLPAACAWFWGRSLGALWAISLGVSLTGTLVGLLASYAYNWPSGATVVLALCILFALSAGGAWLRQSARQRA